MSQLPTIISTVIARSEDVVLTELNVEKGNYPLVIREVIKKIPKNTAKIYSYGQKYFLVTISSSNNLILSSATSSMCSMRTTSPISA